jgi:DnaK suppressor protein
MTEEQLLAQSADDYMNDDQLAFFNDLLASKTRELKLRIEDNQSLCKIERQSDDGDTASTEEDRAKAMRLIEIDTGVLKRIRAAQDAIENGTFGFCADSGEPIGLKRLLIVPESLLSVDAMQAREDRARHQRVAA